MYNYKMIQDNGKNILYSQARKLEEVIDYCIGINDQCEWSILKSSGWEERLAASIKNGQYTIYTL